MQSPEVLLCNPGIRTFYEELVWRGEIEEARRYLKVCANVRPEKPATGLQEKEEKTREKTAPTVQDIARVMAGCAGGMTAEQITRSLKLHQTHVAVINRRLWRGKARGWFVLIEGTGQSATYDLTPDGAQWAKHGTRMKYRKSVEKEKDIESVKRTLAEFVAAGKSFSMVAFQRKAGIYPSWFTRNKDWYHKVKVVQESLNPKNKRPALCVSSVSFIPDTLLF